MFKKKIKYENVFEWDKSGEGTCFYCKESKPINNKFIGEKGICDDCTKEFTIGMIGVDRHAISVLMPNYNNQKDVVKWLKDHGAKLVFKYKSDGISFYDAINNQKAYEEYHKELEKNGWCAMSEELIYASNSVEISDDGHLHIIY